MSTRTLCVGVLILIAGCATSPLGRRQFMFVGDAEMDKMGVEAFETIKKEQKLSGDPQANGYVTCVANAITAELPPEATKVVGSGPWEVRVFQDDTANAFALPGRKIGVHTGLLKIAKNQDQLATVLGHEVAHVTARHSAERVSENYAAQGLGALVGAAADPANPIHKGLMGALGVGTQVGLLKFSRDHETEADRLGLDYMARAGFDPSESVPLWQSMAAASKSRPIELLSTHPAPESRIQDLQRRVPQNLPVMEQARSQGRKPRCG